MLRTICVGFVSLVAPMLPAQAPSPAPNDEWAAARARLVTALQKTATLKDVAFDCTWGPPAAKDVNAPRDPFAPAGGTLHGSWHADRTLYQYERTNTDELIVTGRGTIACDAERSWCHRVGRFADGQPVSYRPDPPLLLRQLAALDLAVVHRDIGMADERPVEIVTVTLTPDQANELLRSGLLPDTIGNETGLQGLRFRVVQAGAQGAPKIPDATIDLAIGIDPGLSIVRTLHVRCASKRPAGAAGRIVVLGGNGAVQVAKADEPDEAEAEPGAPARFEDHLPVRSQKDRATTDVTFNLTQHGSKAAPPLTPAQQNLLGL